MIRRSAKMKHVSRIAAVGALSVSLTATLLGAVSFAGPDKGKGSYGGHGPKMPNAPHVSVGVPKVSTHVFNVSVPVPNVHVPMFNGEKDKKDGGTETFREKETIIERETIRETTIIEREVINNETVFIGGGGGSSFVIMQPTPVALGKINVVEPLAPKPVKAECIDGKGRLSSAIRVSPAEIGVDYKGEVFRCPTGFALGATVGEWVNGRADYTDGFVIECQGGEALRFGQAGRLACAPEERRADLTYPQLAGGPLAEVLIHRGTGTSAGGRGTAADLGGLVLTGGVGGRVY
jgi:hypothetical protein